MITQSKENEAKEVAKRKQIELQKLREKQLREEKLKAGTTKTNATAAAAAAARGSDGSDDYMMGDAADYEDSSSPRHPQQTQRPARQPVSSRPATSTGLAAAPIVPTWNPAMNENVMEYKQQHQQASSSSSSMPGMMSTSASAPRKGMTLGGSSANRQRQ